LLPRNGSQEPLVIEDNVLAYFWAPNGKKLAYVTPSERGGSLRWLVLEVDTGKRLPLVDFLPSRDQMTMLEFYDQYSHSHSVWSPDSRYLVFSGRVEEGETMASLVSQPTSQGQYVLVMDTEANGFAIPIAEGTLGVWSPR
jgi:TolB protein